MSLSYSSSVLTAATYTPTLVVLPTTEDTPYTSVSTVYADIMSSTIYSTQRGAVVPFSYRYYDSSWEMMSTFSEKINILGRHEQEALRAMFIEHGGFSY